MSGFVYVWYDRKHKRYYVGSHWGREDDGYVCSSSWMKQAYAHRPQDFKRRIVQRVATSRKDLLIAEGRWLSMIKGHEIKTRYYNFHNREPNHWTAVDDSRTVRQKISDTLTGVIQSEETRRKRADSMKKAWEEGRHSGFTGKTHTDEYRARMSLEKSGPKSPEHQDALRKAAARRKGVPTGRSHVNQRTATSNKLKELWRDPKYREKMTLVGRTAMLGKSNPVKGTLWWTDGERNVRRAEQPGAEWYRGRS